MSAEYNSVPLFSICYVYLFSLFVFIHTSVFVCVSALDPAKDPCLKIKCGRHKVCVAEGYQTPTCVSQRRMR